MSLRSYFRVLVSETIIKLCWCHEEEKKCFNILEKMKLQAGSLLEEYKGRQKGEKVNTVFEDVTRGQ